MALQKEGLTHEQAKDKIWMVDSKGLIVKGREGVKGHKADFAHVYKQMKGLQEIVHELKPTALIGNSNMRFFS